MKKKELLEKLNTLANQISDALTSVTTLKSELRDIEKFIENELPSEEDEIENSEGE